MMSRGFERLLMTVLMSPSVPAKTVIAVAPQAIASAYSGEPEIEIASAPTLHTEDSSPQAIGTPGAPNVVAAPTRSFFRLARSR